MIKNSTRKEAEAFLQEVFERHRQRHFKNAMDMSVQYAKARSFATRLKRIAIARGIFKDEREWSQHYQAPHSRTYRFVCGHCGKPSKLVRVIE